MMQEKIPPLKVSTGWIDIIITGEPSVILSFKGYIPSLPVRVKKTGLDYFLYIAAKSIADGLEPLRHANRGLFTGLEISIRKSSNDKFSPYELRETK
jgi:hypothetical protein